MPRVRYIEPGGREHTLELNAGSSLMRGAVDAGIDGIEAQCGGNCACATCHVFIAPDWQDKVDPPLEGESSMLEYVQGAQPSSRLSCQIAVTGELDGLVVRMPEQQ